LATQSKLGLAGCGGRWAADVNNAIAASERQLLARPMACKRWKSPPHYWQAGAIARQAIRSLFRFRFCLAAAEAAVAVRVNTAVEFAKSSDCSLIHSLVVDSVD